MAVLATGTVTFLFTDVEGSTRLWEQQPAAIRKALTRHDAIIEQEVAAPGWWSWRRWPTRPWSRRQWRRSWT